MKYATDSSETPAVDMFISSPAESLLILSLHLDTGKQIDSWIYPQQSPLLGGGGQEKCLTVTVAVNEGLARRVRSVRCLQVAVFCAEMPAPRVMRWVLCRHWRPRDLLLAVTMVTMTLLLSQALFRVQQPNDVVDVVWVSGFLHTPLRQEN